MYYNLSAESTSHDFSLSEKPLPLIKMKHLSHFVVTQPVFLWVSVFLSRVLEPEDSPGRRIQKSSGFMVLQIGSYKSFVFLPSPGFCSNLPAAYTAALLLSLYIHGAASILGMLPGCAALPFQPISCHFISHLLKNEQKCKNPLLHSSSVRLLK